MVIYTEKQMEEYFGYKKINKEWTSITKEQLKLMIETLNEYDECLWGEWNGTLNGEQTQLLNDLNDKMSKM